MSTRVDVLVVGAGPAGAAAATLLARAGRQVVVVDRARFPRDKVCGDGLTTGALRHLEELGLDPAEVPSWQRVDDVVVAPPYGREVTFPLPRGRGTYAAVARRAELDAALVGVARRAGAQVHEGAALTGAEDDGDVVRARVDGLGEVVAPYVVGADGMWSPLRRALGHAVPGYRGEWHAFRQYLGGVAEPARRDLWVWFEADLVPGYAWSFPLADGTVNVGFGIQRGGRVAVREMAELWRGLLRRDRLAAVLGHDWEPEGPHRAWPIPARVERTVLAAGRALFVGDAAAATDPMTGEGIGQALDTGAAAARALLGAGVGAGAPARARHAYEREVRRGLALDNRLAGTLVRALQHRKGAEAAVRVAGATAWTRRNFGRWLFEDYPRAVLATPHRWRRGVLTGPGAYRSSPAPGVPTGT